MPSLCVHTNLFCTHCTLLSKHYNALKMYLISTITTSINVTLISYQPTIYYNNIAWNHELLPNLLFPAYFPLSALTRLRNLKRGRCQVGVSNSVITLKRFRSNGGLFSLRLLDNAFALFQGHICTQGCMPFRWNLLDLSFLCFLGTYL